MFLCQNVESSQLHWSRIYWIVSSEAATVCFGPEFALDLRCYQFPGDWRLMESKQAWQMHQHLVFSRRAAQIQYGSIGQAQCKLPMFSGYPAGGWRWSRVLMWYTCSGTSQPGVNQWGHGGWKGRKAKICRRLASCFYCALGVTPKGLRISLDKKGFVL